MAKKRIYNQNKHKYYRIRERSSKNGRRGQIKGSWSNPKLTNKSKEGKKSFFSFIRRK